MPSNQTVCHPCEFLMWDCVDYAWLCKRQSVKQPKVLSPFRFIAKYDGIPFQPCWCPLKKKEVPNA